MDNIYKIYKFFLLNQFRIITICTFITYVIGVIIVIKKKYLKKYTIPVRVLMIIIYVLGLIITFLLIIKNWNLNDIPFNTLM